MNAVVSYIIAHNIQKVTDCGCETPEMFDMSVQYARSASSEGKNYQVASLEQLLLTAYSSDVMTRHTSIHNAASLLIKKQPRKVSWYAFPLCAVRVLR
jgi:hypothetical protein